MYSGHFSFPTDISNGIVDALADIATNGREPIYTVITTAPHQWFSHRGGDHLTVLDISPLTGPTFWSKMHGQDIADKMLAAGWPGKSVATQCSFDDGTRADAALLDDDGKLVAIVGEAKLKKSIDSKVQAIQQAWRLAKATDAPFAVVGHDGAFEIIEVATNKVTNSSHFPTPSDLGVNFEVETPSLESADDTSTYLRCATYDELIAHLNGASTVIIDHTLPWGDRLPDALDVASLNLPIVPPGGMGSLGIFNLIAANSPKVSRLVSLWTRHLVTTPAHARMRDYLSTRFGVAGILELPTETFASIANIPTSIVALGDYPIQQNQLTAFASLTQRGDLIESPQQTWLRTFHQSLNGEEAKLGFVAPLRELWTVASHAPESRAIEERLKRLGTVVTLGDLCEIIQGFPHSRERASGNKGIRVLRGREIKLPPPQKDELEKFEPGREVPERCLIRADDVLLQRIGQTPRCMIAPPELEGVVAGDTTYILRLKDDQISAYLLAQFLGSSAGQNLLSARSTGVAAPTLSRSTLANLPVPVLPDNVAEDLAALASLEVSLRTRAEKLSAARLGLFDADSLDELQSNLAQTRQTAKAVSESVRQAETQDFQIRNFYPFAIAFSYRTLSGLISPQELYKEQFRVTKNVLALLGSTTLALLSDEERAFCGIKIKQTFSGGGSHGKWRTMSQKGITALKEREEKSSFAKLLISLWDNSEWSDTVEQMINLQNDYHHGHDSDYEKLAQQASAHLDTLMAHLAFLTDYPMRLIYDQNAIRNSNRVIIHSLNYSGDHPGLRQEDTEYSRALIKNDLYLQLESDNWIPLFPYLKAHLCPHCKSRETFFLDVWDKDEQRFKLKSFERGHIEYSAEVFKALAPASQ